MTVNIYQPTSEDSLNQEEMKLYTQIMDYRASKGLPLIPLSKALTTVAGRHALDTVENIGGYIVGDPGENKAHGWSDAPYDGRNPSTFPNMWDAPERLGTGYTDNGYEISVGFLGSNLDPRTAMTANVALDAWKGSPSHNAVIINVSPWDSQWHAIGVGIYKQVAHVWFGKASNSTGAPAIVNEAIADIGTHGATWPISGVGDFNADGDSDILWREPGTGRVDQWQMKNGGWGGSVDLGGGKTANWTLAGMAISTATDVSDILWRDIPTSKVDQWHMANGNWSQSIDLGGGKGADWTLAGIGDFNGDGTSDILWRKTETGQVDQWQMKNGNWSASIDLGAGKGADWSLAGVGDFNGDGTSDILWRNVNTSQVDQWEMKNGNWSKSIDLGAGKGANWTVAGIGDFNADGTSDILWFNTINGREEYWTMKNGNWGGSVDLGYPQRVVEAVRHRRLQSRRSE